MSGAVSSPERGSGERVSALRAGPFHVAEVVHRGGTRLGAHAHDHACVHWVLDGVYSERTARGALRVERGETLLKPPGLRHWNGFEASARSLRIDFPIDACESHGVALPTAARGVERTDVSRICATIVAELVAADECTAMAVHGLCLQLVAALVDAERAAGRGGRARSSSPGVARCAAALRDRFREPVCFTSLAREVGLSRSHLATRFRRETGATLGEFVRRLRVDHAIGLLSDPGRSLAEIALASGFADQSHLTRVFRAATGLTPGAWRRRRGG